MKIKLLLLTLVAIVCSSCNQKPKIEVNDDESIVYFCSEITPENILKLYEALDADNKGKIGLKVHLDRKSVV